MPTPLLAHRADRDNGGGASLPQLALKEVRTCERAEEIGSGEQDADALSVSDGDENIVGGEGKRAAQKCSHRLPSRIDSAQTSTLARFCTHPKKIGPNMVFTNGSRISDRIAA